MPSLCNNGYFSVEKLLRKDDAITFAVEEVSWDRESDETKDLSDKLDFLFLTSTQNLNCSVQRVLVEMLPPVYRFDPMCTLTHNALKLAQSRRLIALTSM